MPSFAVRDIMTTDVVTLEEDENLDVADTVMNLARIRHLPVVSHGRLVGLVTHRDLLAAQVSSIADVSAKEDQEIKQSITATQIMRTSVHTVAPDTPVLEAARVRGRNGDLKIETSLIRTRNPGAAIVEEAERRSADVIYMSTVHAPPSESALGPTATYLLEKRSCRVVIETDAGSSNGRVV